MVIYAHSTVFYLARCLTGSFSCGVAEGRRASSYPNGAPVAIWHHPRFPDSHIYAESSTGEPRTDQQNLFTFNNPIGSVQTCNGYLRLTVEYCV